MEPKNSRARIFANLGWRFAERIGARGVSFVVSIVLARLLAPEAYGTIALVTVFTTVLQVFVDSGMGNALIQKKDADDLDFSTVFYFNFTVCLGLYALMFLAAPWIARFYNDPELTPVIRVLSLTLVISGVKNIQQAYVSRNLLFKRFFFATLGGTVGAAAVGITMAKMGFGVWALVAQQLFNNAVDTLILWITVKWRPKWKFSFARLRGLFSYGWKLLASGLLDTLYRDLRQLIIGKLYSKEELAFYEKGNQFPTLIINSVGASIDSVLLPVMAKEQDHVQTVRAMTRRAIQTGVYLISPLMLGLAAMAPTFVRLLLTEKWMPCVPYLRIICVAYMLYPIHTANLNAIKAMGRSDLFLKLEIVKKVMGLVLLAVTARLGVMAMVYSLLFSDILSQIINSWPNRTLLGYSYLAQLKDIFGNLLLSVGMALCVAAAGLLPLNVAALFFVQLAVGAAVYIVGSAVTKNPSWQYVLSIVKGQKNNAH